MTRRFCSIFKLCKTALLFRKLNFNCFTNPFLSGKFFEEEATKNCSCLDSCKKTTYETDLSYAFFKGINTTSLYKQFNAARFGSKIPVDAKWREYLRQDIEINLTLTVLLSSIGVDHKNDLWIKLLLFQSLTHL